MRPFTLSAPETRPQSRSTVPSFPSGTGVAWSQPLSVWPGAAVGPSAGEMRAQEHAPYLHEGSVLAYSTPGAVPFAAPMFASQYECYTISGVPAGYQMIYSPMRPQSAFGTAWPVPDVSGHYGGYAPQAGPSSSADTIFATHSDPGMHAPLRDLVHAATALGDGVPATSSRLSSHPHPPARDDRDDKTFMCGTCDLPFASYAEYAAHQQHRHRSVPGTGGAKGRKYVCDVCAHVCMQSSDLKKHLRTHTGERPYECTICLSRFSRSDNLRVHVTNVHDMKKKGRRMDAVREESAARKDGDAPSPPKRVKPELTA